MTQRLNYVDRETIVDAMGVSRRLSMGQTEVLDIIRGTSVMSKNRLGRDGSFLPQNYTERNAAAKLVEYGVAHHVTVTTRNGPQVGIVYSNPLAAVCISGKAAELLESMCAALLGQDPKREDVAAVHRHLRAQIKIATERYNEKVDPEKRDVRTANQYLGTVGRWRGPRTQGVRIGP